ncbi:hypothetical protein [Pseudoalteromonas 'SMAR']|uniref:hypothetical protein n=1 Tax=Pseudoalteromonas 'SMAR' TaxID=3416908 RepID=UPI003AF23919
MSVAISLKSKLKCCGAFEAQIIELNRATEQMIQKVKGRLGNTIFTYWVFWAFILIPIILSLILMCAIAIGDALEFTKITKESLDTFIEYQKVPLVILGLSIPFGTLAAANFRAKQFHRNLERQEYEHQIDLYHKDLDFFERKLDGAVGNRQFQYISKQHAALVFNNSRHYPVRGGMLFDATPKRYKALFLASDINTALAYLVDINKKECELSEKEIDDELFRVFFTHLDNINDVVIDEIKVLTFMTKFYPTISKVANKIGIDQPKIDDGYSNYCIFFREAISVVSVVYDLDELSNFPLTSEFWRNRNNIIDRCNFVNSEIKISAIADYYRLPYKKD